MQLLGHLEPPVAPEVPEPLAGQRGSQVLLSLALRVSLAVREELLVA